MNIFNKAVSSTNPMQDKVLEYSRFVLKTFQSLSNQTKEVSKINMLDNLVRVGDLDILMDITNTGYVRGMTIARVKGCSEAEDEYRDKKTVELLKKMFDKVIVSRDDRNIYYDAGVTDNIPTSVVNAHKMATVIDICADELAA
jgi:hypothetical protein